jgi:mannose-6-phosphate isomerase-like protein (cupin superfamily)
MDLVLDSGETQHLQPGDSVVQRGTMHAWRNTGTVPCVAVAFMVRAQ